MSGSTLTLCHQPLLRPLEHGLPPIPPQPPQAPQPPPPPQQEGILGRRVVRELDPEPDDEPPMPFERRRALFARELQAAEMVGQIERVQLEPLQRIG